MLWPVRRKGGFENARTFPGEYCEKHKMLGVSIDFTNEPGGTRSSLRFGAILLEGFRAAVLGRDSVYHGLGLAYTAKQGSDIFRKSLIELAGQPFLQFRLFGRSQRMKLQSDKTVTGTPAHLGFGEYLALAAGEAKAYESGRIGIQGGRGDDRNPALAYVHGLAQEIFGQPRSNQGGNLDGAPEIAPPLTHHQPERGPQGLINQGGRKGPLQHKGRVRPGRSLRFSPRGN